MINETKKQLQTLKEQVLQAIHSDSITMRSRYYFMVKSALFACAFILVFALLLYLVSLIGFTLRGNGLHALPHFGARGWGTLFMSLPWLLLSLVFLVFILLQVLSTHFSFTYRRPLIHTVLASIFIIVLGGTLIAQSTLHDRAYRFSQERNVPVARSLYGAMIHTNNSVHIGRIMQSQEHTLLVQRRDGVEYAVNITTKTKLPREQLTPEMVIVVLGIETASSTIEALGIHPFNPSRVLLPPPPREMEMRIR